MATATCPKCMQRVRIVIPSGGDGSGDVFVRHKRLDPRVMVKVQCPGSRTLAPGRDNDERTTTDAR